MLRRVLVPALAVSLSMASSPAASAAASAPGGRVVVITVDGTSIHDWARAGAFGTLGSAGLLATRTATETKDPVLLRAAAYTTLGAGAPAELESTAARIDAGSGVLPGAMGEALKRRGLSATSIGDASGNDVRDGPGSRAVMHADGGIAFPPTEVGAPPDALDVLSRPEPGAPTGRSTDYAAMADALERALVWARVVVVDLGDTARADRTFWESPASRRSWVDRALRKADTFAQAVRDALNPGDTVIVASLVPPLARARIGARLAAVAMTGTRGMLTSGTTRREGVLALTDLAPTILDRAGVAVPDEMQGRTARVEPSAMLEVEALDAAFARARSARWPVTRIWLFSAVAFGLVAFLMIAAGRGRGPGAERIPRRSRDLVATGLMATAVTPAAALIAPQLPGSSIEVLGVWTIVLSIGGALLARIALGTQAGLTAIALADAAVVVGDLLAGSPLASRSPLGFLVAGGGRFYGIDEGLLGIALAGSAVAVAGWLDGRLRPRRIWIAAVPLAVVAVVSAAPSLGSKFGAGFTLVPAFGVLLVLAFGHRFDRVAVIAIAIATVLLVGGLAAADALAAPEARSHIGREIAGQTPAAALVVRKITSFLRITGTTIWLPVSVVIAAPMIVLLRRRANLLARGFWGAPARRSALIAVAVGCVAGMGANDTGIIVVAPALVVTAAAFYTPLLAPRTQSRRRP